MRCSEIQEKLSAFYDGALREAERETVEAHLRQCAECQREFAALQTTSRLLQAWDAPKVGPRVQAVFMAELEERAARQPWWATLFAGWQKPVAWATAAAAVLIVVVLGVNRPTPQINNTREENSRSYTTGRSPGVEKSNSSDHLTMNIPKENGLRTHPPAPKKLAMGTEKGALSPPTSGPLADAAAIDNLSKKMKKPLPPQFKDDEVMIAKIQPAPSTTRDSDAFRVLPGGVSAKADGTIALDEAGGILSKEGNALLALNVTPPPAEEAANYVRTIVAEVAEPLTAEFIDVTVTPYVEKRPERMLTDWITETDD